MNPVSSSSCLPQYSDHATAVTAFRNSHQVTQDIAESVSSVFPTVVAHIIGDYAISPDVFISSLLQRIAIENKEPTEEEKAQLRTLGPLVECLDLRLPTPPPNSLNERVYACFSNALFNMFHICKVEESLLTSLVNLRELNISGTRDCIWMVNIRKFRKLEKLICDNSILSIHSLDHFF